MSGQPALPAIELIDVHCELGGTRILRGVSFAVPSGRITALIGPSGVGKTTTLRHIVGLIWPDEGDILVEGRSILAMKKADRQKLGRRSGVLLQGAGVYGSALWDSMTVEENLLHQLRAQREWDDDAINRRVADRLAEVGLSSSARLPPTALSAGMRRRLALARALVADPDFAVLDSFELGADPVTLRVLCEVVARRHGDSGATFLLTTQSMDVVRRLADEIVVMWDGRVIAEGPAEEVLASREAEIQQLLSGSTTGPLGMHPPGPVGAQPAARGPEAAGGAPAPAPTAPPGESGFDLPPPLVAGALLVAITASALWLGGAKPFELVLIATVWMVVGVLVALRRRAVRRQQRLTAAGGSRPRP